MDKFDGTRGLAVPNSRLSRLWHLGRATGDLAAGVGLRALVGMALNRGTPTQRIQLSPEHTRRFTDRLARMRGAVMKMGQLMSMDGSDVFMPRIHPDLSSTRILAMDFAEGVPVDALADRDYRHAERDRAAALLSRLMLRELFEFGLSATPTSSSASSAAGGTCILPTPSTSCLTRRHSSCTVNSWAPLCCAVGCAPGSTWEGSWRNMCRVVPALRGSTDHH